MPLKFVNGLVISSLTLYNGCSYILCYHHTRFLRLLFFFSLHWRHNDHGGVSNHQPHGCLLNRLFRRKSKKTSKLRVTGHCAHRGPVNSPHKWPVTRKMVPFNDVLMFSIFQMSLKLHLPSEYRAITWTNDGYITDAYMRHSASMSWNFLMWLKNDDFANTEILRTN